jgi:Holliday junction resolvasome RuvABC DNA-binding subunit
VVEFRDKIQLETVPVTPTASVGATSDGEVVEALMALGYRADESRRALKETTGTSVPANASPVRLNI